MSTNKITPSTCNSSSMHQVCITRILRFAARSQVNFSPNHIPSAPRRQPPGYSICMPTSVPARSYIITLKAPHRQNIPRPAHVMHVQTAAELPTPMLTSARCVATKTPTSAPAAVITLVQPGSQYPQTPCMPQTSSPAVRAYSQQEVWPTTQAVGSQTRLWP